MIDKRTHSYIHSNFKANKWIALICEWCKEPFQGLRANIMYKKSQGQTRFYCCKSHQVKKQHELIHGGSRWLETECGFCKKLFKRICSQIKAKKSLGQKNFYCSRRCQAKANPNLLHRMFKKQLNEKYMEGIYQSNE